MTHLVNQLKFEVNCPDEEQAFQLRHSFQDTLQEQIIKVVEEVSSAYVPGDEWIQIDRIEIDAGTFSSSSLYTDFSRVFQKKFEEELAKKLSAITVKQRDTSRQSSWIALFMHFLESGSLPWWAIETEIDIGRISDELFLTQLETLRQYFHAKRFQPGVWTRAAFQLDAKANAHIVSFFETLVKAKKIFTSWATILSEKLYIGDWQTAKAAVIDKVLVRNGPVILGEKEIAKMLTRIFTDHLEEIVSLPGDLPFVQISAILQETVNAEPFSGLAMEDVIQGPSEVPLDFGRGLIQPVALNKIPGEQYRGEEVLKYIVREGGVILLSPFFRQLFLKLQLYDNSGWTSKEAPWRAVHIIKFLGTGQQQQPEYTLVLEKLLCGLSPEEPVPLEISLTDTEIEEATSLLTSVLEHWQALRNTSLAGLRETFFKRDGLITRKQNGWLLQVERKTLDVLLDSLPWGYSAVSLPWNDYIIYTEW